MQFEVIRQSRPAASRNAVIFCCDQRYLPFASLAIYTLMSKTVDPKFDICIVSLDDLTIPEVISAGNIRNCQVSLSGDDADLPTSDRFSVAAYLRLMLPRMFGKDYDRILYLDCDVMVVGTELNSVFDLDIRGAPFGAIMDSLKMKYPKEPTFDQKAVGEKGPYFNSGVLLIDTQAFEEQKIFEKCLDALRRHGPEKIYFDQTMLNIAAKQNWTQLDYGWNWQWSVTRPMFEMYIDVQIIHFISAHKPWTDPGGKLPAQHRLFATRFLKRYFPEVAVRAPKYPRKLKIRKVFAMFWKHVTMAPRFVRAYNLTGGDISKVIAPADVRAIPPKNPPS